jgi:hypothetical protein
MVVKGGGGGPPVFQHHDKITTENISKIAFEQGCGPAVN